MAVRAAAPISVPMLIVGVSVVDSFLAGPDFSPTHVADKHTIRKMLCRVSRQDALLGIVWVRSTAWIMVSRILIARNPCAGVVYEDRGVASYHIVRVDF